MAFTKVHYAEIATALRETYDHARELVPEAERATFAALYVGLVNRFAALFCEDNPRFSTARFAKQCGITDKKEHSGTE